MKNTGFRKGTFYWNNLVLVLVAACLPALLIGIGVYNLGGGQIVRKLNEAHQTQLNQSIQRVDETLSRLELFAAQLAFHPDFDESLNERNFSEQFQMTRDLFRSLSLMKEGNPLVFDVSLYLEDSGRLISDHWGVRTIANDADRESFRRLLGTKGKIAWTDELNSLTPGETPYKGVVTKLYAKGDETPFGAFFIYIRPSEFDQLIRRLASGGGTAFLTDRDGRIVAADDSGSAALQEALVRRMTPASASSNTFVSDWEGSRYSVSYGQLSRFGNDWTYVSATPLTNITAPVSAMSRMIVAVGGFGLALALLLSWFASKRIYNPIRKLVGLFHSTPAKESGDRGLNEIAFIERQWKRHLDENEALQGRLRLSLPSLREAFLMQYLQGRFVALSEREIVEKLRQYDWRIEGKRFAVMAAVLYGREEPERKYTSRDAQLIDYAATNIIQELCRTASVHAQAINFQNSTIGVMLVLDPAEPAAEARRALLGLAENVADTVSGLLKVGAAVAVGKTTDKALELPELMDEAAKALRLRDPNVAADVLDVDDIMPALGQPVEFPLELERDVIQAMRMGLGEEASAGVREFVEAIRRSGGTQMHVQQGMLKLLGSAYDAMLRSGVNPDVVYGGAHLYEELMGIRQPEEMARWFSASVVGPFVGSVASAIDPETRSIVDRVAEQLRLELASDVSLDLYADRFGISPFKLSRAFKQVTGVNFIDYLTGLRIEKCKELLVTTDMKINDIAESLQYQPSYLIRLFKKSTEMTPGQFREKHTRVVG
ncbi:AraC family transcriptional regulator [Paenibacillus flagellatus]|uniref:AraC family transcriptional regulator n=1 Tax=Paenibacillus flagellatus TaxID=2211139 RepID=UPI0011B6496A|nr:AraC family transcriptional regulator [Paenibacillus flagellatus]